MSVDALLRGYIGTLAILRDYAGCRAVLHDAREEQRPEVAELEAVLSAAEERIWDGGAISGAARVASKRPPRLPRLDIESFWGSASPAAFIADAHRAWATRMRQLHRAEILAQWRDVDWLAWDNRTSAARGRSWNPLPNGGMSGIDPTTFAAILREHYPPNAVYRMAEQSGPITGLQESVARAPSRAYVSPAVYERLQQRTDRFHRHIRERVQSTVHREVMDQYLATADAEVSLVAQSCGARTSGEVFDEAVLACAVLYVFQRELVGEGALEHARRRRDEALAALRRSAQFVFAATWLGAQAASDDQVAAMARAMGYRPRFGGAEPVPPSRTAPTAFGQPARRGEIYETVHVDEAADITSDAMMRVLGTAVQSQPRRPPLSYRPRWAAGIAQSLAIVLRAPLADIQGTERLDRTSALLGRVHLGIDLGVPPASGAR